MAFYTSRRGISFLLALSFTVSCCGTGVDARQAYSTIQANVREEAEIEPFAGGKKVGPVHDWTLLCKIEGDQSLKDKVIKSAEEGSLEHAFIVACMYMHGKGIEKDQKAAFEIFKSAANKGHSNSQNNLGFMFEEGIGVKKDIKQAISWYQKAADFNNPAALCNLAYLYEHGIGFPASIETAMPLYEKSASLGNKIAKQNLDAFEFERTRNTSVMKLKGIQVAESEAAGAKKPTLAVAGQKPVYVYKPIDSAEVNQAIESAKLTAAAAAVKEQATPPAKPAASAAPKQPLSALIGSALASKPGAAVPADKAQGPAAILAKLNKPADKKGAAAPNAKADKGKTEAPAAKDGPAPVAEATPAPSGFQAGTPTLTAILQRLSKGTSLESSVQPTSSAPAETAEAKTEKPAKTQAARAASSDGPALLTSATPVETPALKQAEKKTEPVKAKADAKKTAEKPVEAKKVDERASSVLPTAAVKKPGTSLVAAYSDEKMPEVQEKKTMAPPVPKTEAKPAPAAVEKKVATATQVPAAKPAMPPAKVTATASSAAAKNEEFKQLQEKVANGNRPIRDKWALVVGITDFQDPDIPDLQFSTKDATDFYNYLVKEANFAPDHVRLLLNEQATQRRVLSELGSKFLARVVKPDDLVVLYFSTHGSPSQLDPRGKNYLVAQDSDSDDLFATGIEMQKLLDSIQGRVLTDRVLLVLDACHSGFAADDSKGMARIGNFNATDIVQGSGQLVICSSLPDERAWESSRYQNGVFTRKLLEGLRSKGNKTTLVEAFTAARQAVADEVKEDRPGAKQTPVLKGKWNGNDLIVAVPPVAPQTVPASVASSLGTDSRNDLLANRPKSGTKAVDEGDYAKPANNSAPRSGIIYLDSQFFSVSGNPREVAREYNEAIKSSRNDSELYFVRAKALIQLEDWYGALNCLEDALKLSPNRAQYYLGRAYVNFRLGKKVLAQQDLEQAKFYDSKLADNIKIHM